MRKILSIVGTSVVSLMLATGCSNLQMGAHIDTGDETIAKTAIYVGELDSHKAIGAIKAAGEKTGWRVTDFKTDSVIVEKNLDDKMISSTIKYHNGHISGDHENAPMNELLILRKAIVKELKSKSEHH